MTDEEKVLAAEVLKFLRAANIQIQGNEDYVGTGYYLNRGKAAISIERLHDAQLATPLRAAEPGEATLLRLANEERAEHLVRYLTNRKKRTGQKWVVVEQYKTEGAAWRSEGYHRALLRTEDGSTMRIYYRWWEKCWVRAQGPSAQVVISKTFSKRTH